jgi:hypothetical protein
MISAVSLRQLLSGNDTAKQDVGVMMLEFLRFK